MYVAPLASTRKLPTPANGEFAELTSTRFAGESLGEPLGSPATITGWTRPRLAKPAKPVKSWAAADAALNAQRGSKCSNLDRRRFRFSVRILKLPGAVQGLRPSGRIARLRLSSARHRHKKIRAGLGR